MPWIWAALMPHPPIIVPEVGRGREKDAAPTLQGMEKLLTGLAQAGNGRAPKPDVLLLLSPHQPNAAGSFFMNSAPSTAGSLGRFGAPSVSAYLQTPLGILPELSTHLARHGINVMTRPMPDITQDHGSIVPLYYLAKCWPDETLPPVITASPIGLEPAAALALGKALAAFDNGLSCALLASGDLSHRLTRDAPSGYSPEGAVFDQAVVRALKEGNPGILLDLPANTREQAGECGLRSVLTLLGLCGGPVEVYSYEGPFGVGYCTALWPRKGRAAAQPSEKQNAAAETGTSHPYPKLARLTVERLLAGGPLEIRAKDVQAFDADPRVWKQKKACFVSIKTKAGTLRGCIGSILPVHESLDKEIVMNAVSAATRDPRFPPMRAEELEGVTFSVDVLSIPEPVNDINELNPAEWGVIVTKDGKRGLLLPDLEGVDTVVKQLSIAAQKGGIRDLKDAQIQRFSVTRHKEA